MHVYTPIPTNTHVHHSVPHCPLRCTFGELQILSKTHFESLPPPHPHPLPSSHLPPPPSPPIPTPHPPVSIHMLLSKVNDPYTKIRLLYYCISVFAQTTKWSWFHLQVSRGRIRRKLYCGSVELLRSLHQSQLQLCQVSSPLVSHVFPRQPHLLPFPLDKRIN